MLGQNKIKKKNGGNRRLDMEMLGCNLVWTLVPSWLQFKLQICWAHKAKGLCFANQKQQSKIPVPRLWHYFKHTIARCEIVANQSHYFFVIIILILASLPVKWKSETASAAKLNFDHVFMWAKHSSLCGDILNSNISSLGMGMLSIFQTGSLKKIIAEDCVLEVLYICCLFVYLNEMTSPSKSRRV